MRQIRFMIMAVSLCACAAGFAQETYTDNIRPEGRVVGVGTVRKAATVYGDLVTTATEAHDLAEQATIDIAALDELLGDYALDADLTSGLALKVNKAGDTMTGPLLITQAAEGFIVTDTGSGAQTLIRIKTASATTGATIGFNASDNLQIAGEGLDPVSMPFLTTLGVFLGATGGAESVALGSSSNEMTFQDAVANGGSQIKLDQLLTATENGQSITKGDVGGSLQFSVVNSGSEDGDNVVFFIGQSDSGYDLSMAVYPDGESDAELAGGAIFTATTSAVGMKFGPDQGPVSFYSGAVNDPNDLIGWIDGDGFHSPGERWTYIPVVSGVGLNEWSGTPDESAGFALNLKTSVDGEKAYFPISATEGTVITQIRVKWEGFDSSDGVKFTLLRRVESPFTSAEWTVCGATQTAVGSVTTTTTYNVPDTTIAANTGYMICVESEVGGTETAVYAVGYATTGRVY